MSERNDMALERIKKYCLWLLIGSLGLSGILGIFVIAFGDFGDTEVKLLLTTLTISYYSLTSLTCAVGLKQMPVRVMALAGIAASGFGAITAGVSIWGDWYGSRFDIERLVAVTAIWAFAFAHATILSRARLKRQWRPILGGVLLSIFGLALLFSLMISYNFDDEVAFRVAGVLGILVGCGTIIVPILARLTGPAVGAGPDEPYPQIVVICPRCSTRAAMAVGRDRCTRCGLTIQIRILPDASA